MRHTPPLSRRSILYPHIITLLSLPTSATHSVWIATPKTAFASAQATLRQQRSTPTAASHSCLTISQRQRSHLASGATDASQAIECREGDEAPPSFLDLGIDDIPESSHANASGDHASVTPGTGTGEEKHHQGELGVDRLGSDGDFDNEKMLHPPPSGALSTRSQSPQLQLTAVRMHNLPRHWMHEEVIAFIHSVGEHAGVPFPMPASDRHAASAGAGNAFHEEEEEFMGHEEEEDAIALPPAKSPYVHRLTIPLGRRTGLVYGNPLIILTSRDLARYLVRDLHFDPDDSRSRIFFTMEEATAASVANGAIGDQRMKSNSNEGDGSNKNEHARRRGGTTRFEEIEDDVGAEQAEALRTLELDRFLMAPDLLLDIAKMHQRRLLTSNEKVLLDSFLETDSNDVEVEELETNGGDFSSDAGTVNLRERHTDDTMRQKSRTEGTKTVVGKKKKLQRRAGSLREPGRGSMHNTPIPKPYVQGRPL